MRYQIPSLRTTPETGTTKRRIACSERTVPYNQILSLQCILPSFNSLSLSLSLFRIRFLFILRVSFCRFTWSTSLLFSQFWLQFPRIGSDQHTYLGSIHFATKRGPFSLKPAVLSRCSRFNRCLPCGGNFRVSRASRYWKSIAVRGNVLHSFRRSPGS